MAEEKNAPVLGQRYIGCGRETGTIEVRQTPGNALGAYLDGGRIRVFCNAQDATGDTMNAGEILIHGSVGDAAGYAMRGGAIYVQGDTGYRCGIHMKEYQDKKPVIVVGGCCGSFLGEYQAGGVILVLGIGAEDRPPVGNFCAAGMHGGIIYLRTEHLPADLPGQITAKRAGREELTKIAPLVRRFCREFGEEEEALLSSCYYALTPNTRNPYRQLYVNN